jgi:hypothetical protein
MSALAVGVNWVRHRHGVLTIRENADGSSDAGFEIENSPMATNTFV